MMDREMRKRKTYKPPYSGMYLVEISEKYANNKAVVKSACYRACSWNRDSNGKLKKYRNEGLVRRNVLVGKGLQGM